MFIVNDHPVPPRHELPRSLFTPVAPSYFETFEIPLLRGRFFKDLDDLDAPPVVIVNRTLANHFWPNENPVGKRLKQGWPENEGEQWPWREIVGMVGDTKQLGLDEATRMQIYIPVNQDPPGSVRLALRTAIEPTTLVAPTKAAVHRIDPDLPVYEIETIEDVISASIAPRRFAMALLAVFAGLALVLAAIGLYGVIAYTVSRRTREIGVRVAMGAQRNDVFSLVVRQGLGMSLLGCLLGIGGAFALTELLSGLLYGVTSRDPVTFLVASLVLMLVSFVACAVPALSATRVDPIRALRYE
jgi:putative ABC transport system permease protein